MMGIYLPKTSNQRCSANTRNSFFLICYIQLFSSSLLFLLFKAESTLEFGASFYAVICQFYSVYYFLIKLWQMPRIIKLIEEFEVFMGKSKWLMNYYWIDDIIFCYFYQFLFCVKFGKGSHGKIAYYELIVKIERMCEIIHIIVAKVSTLGVIQPYVIITIVNYFIFDLKNESFHLPIPVV